MKKVAVCLVLALSALLFSCCREETGRELLDDPAKLERKLEGKTYAEVEEMLGEPDGMLSGFWGDIYHDSEGNEIVIYYDSDGVVETVLAPG